jgi:two-component system chemotaxis response regulator CheB
VRALQAEGDISVVGEAVGAAEALAVVELERPDVVTLDLQIPDGGGQHVIEQIMGSMPIPILVLSATVTSRESVPAVEALMAGAVEAVPKPTHWTATDEALVRRTVRSLSGVTVFRHTQRRHAVTTAAMNGAPSVPTGNGRAPTRRVVAIAASTGGPAALAEVLGGLGGLESPVLVVQHIHTDFVGGFVEWMSRASALPVSLARAGERLEPGTVVIGPGDVHLRLDRQRHVTLDPEPVTVHRPSADELLASVARFAGADGIGVVLTGMGDDGAAGLLALRQVGGTTIAQDQASCAVFGMPRAAFRLGAVQSVIPLDRIAAAIVRAAREVRP